MHLLEYGQIGPSESQDRGCEPFDGGHVADVSRSQDFDMFRERLKPNVLSEGLLQGYRLLRRDVPFMTAVQGNP